MKTSHFQRKHGPFIHEMCNYFLLLHFNSTQINNYILLFVFLQFYAQKGQSWLTKVTLHNKTYIKESVNNENYLLYIQTLCCECWYTVLPKLNKVSTIKLKRRVMMVRSECEHNHYYSSSYVGISFECVLLLLLSLLVKNCNALLYITVNE